MNRAKIARKKTLNIIYFVDSEKTKSLQLHVNTVIGLATALGLMVTWFLASIYLSYVGFKDRSNLLNFVREARSTLFEYETRFEGVYENVYPAEANRESAQNSANSAANESIPAVAPLEVKAPPPVEVKPKVVVAAAPVVPKAPPQAVPVAADGAKAEKTTTANPEEVAEAVPEAFQVNVSNAVFKNVADKLEMRVDINNQDAKNKAEGYVWALATFKSENGEEIFVAAPSAMHVNASGDAGDIKNAQRYAIQYHKPKNFVFNSPKPGAGKFTQVKVVLQNYSGKGSEFKFPIAEAN